MREALMAATKTDSELIVYPGADHGFMAGYRPSYNADAASKAWADMLNWFGKNGEGS